MVDQADRVAVLYSGGTDSTASAALLAERFSHVDLLTFHRLGFHSPEHSHFNRDKLVARFPDVTFRHFIYETTPLARHMTEHRRASYALRYGFFTLQTCGFCALANHVATIAHCKRWGIAHVADGITHDWPFFPAHMDKVIDLLRAFEDSIGLTYHTPVLDCAIDPPMTYFDKITRPGQATVTAANLHTTGRILRRMGLSETDNYKGTATDKQAQQRCFQFMLPDVLAFWVYNAPERWDAYEATVVAYFTELLADAQLLLSEWHEEGKHAALFAYLDDPAALTS